MNISISLFEFGLTRKCYSFLLCILLVTTNMDSAIGSTQDEDYVRLLNQATFGATPYEFERIKSLTASGWIDDQFTKAFSKSNWVAIDEIIAAHEAGEIKLSIKFGDHNTARQIMIGNLWERYITADDQLRQRIAAALLEIFVMNSKITMLNDSRRMASYYVDILEKNAFGNFRTLLEDVSKSSAMGYYLTFINNVKAKYDSAGNPIVIPDENYAREIMQLFSIGLYELKNNGTLKLVSGKPVETYTQNDIFNLARVFTGWRQDIRFSTVDRDGQPMVAVERYHSHEQKSFLGTIIPAGTNANESLKIALDTLFNHPNVGPFIGAQLIQRLVTSNPSPAYVNRVANAFNNNGNGVRGDMKAVIKAILLDPEANPNTSLINHNRWGKMREPMIRLTAVARLLGAQFLDTKFIYPIADLTKIGNGIGQTPLKSPSVFNFFRPGYVPPNFAGFSFKFVAPEFQIINGSSIPASLNFINNFIEKSDQVFSIENRTVLEAQAKNADKLVGFLNFYLTSNTMSPENVSELVTQVNKIPITSPWTRVKAAFQMVSCSPFFLTEQ